LAAGIAAADKALMTLFVLPPKTIEPGLILLGSPDDLLPFKYQEKLIKMWVYLLFLGKRTRVNV
jgi:hypothetical protein